MSAFIKFTPLCSTTGGEGGGASADWHCYLVELDEVKILLDCGWSEQCSTAPLTALASVARQVDIVLLSHATMACLGSYTYAAEKLGLTCPSYASTPVHDLGQQAITDLLESRIEGGEFDLFNAADVETSFKRIIQLRYSQPYALFGRCKGITITAYPAGNSVGATLWSIRKDTDHIIYAIEYNHRKEGLVNGTVLHVTESLARPSLLITDSRCSLIKNSPTKRELDATLASAITAGLAQGAQILIPSDSASRILEIAYILDSLWTSSASRAHIPIFLLAHESPRTLNIIKSSLEWMGDAIAETFSRREIPFSFRHVKFITNLEAVEALGAGPKIVLASCPGMDIGFSRLLFQRWSALPNCLIVLTDRGVPGSLTHTLVEEYHHLLAERDASSADMEGSEGDAPKNDELFIPNIRMAMNMTECHKEPLEGAELQAYLDAAEEKKQAEMVDASDDEDGEEGGGGGALASTATDAHATAHHFDTYLRDPAHSTTSHATSSGAVAGGPNSFFKQTYQFKMFPISIPADSSFRVDDYGQAIDPAAYMKGEFQFAIQASKEAEERALAAKLSEKVEEVIPTKYVSSTLEFTACCLLFYIDYAGVSDGTSIKNILAQVCPRKLVLVSGSEESHNDLKAFCVNTESMTKDVFTPKRGETLNVSAVTNIFQIKLTDSLVTSLSVSVFDDYQLSYVGGLVVTDAEAGAQQPAIQKSDSDLEMAEILPSPTSPVAPNLSEDMQLNSIEGSAQSLPVAVIKSDVIATAISMLDVLPPEQQLYHTPLMIGDVRLSEFRQVLQNAGFTTEFIHGQLFVNGCVFVKKMGGGKLGLEGVLSPDYYKIRTLLYEQHAIL